MTRGRRGPRDGLDPHVDARCVALGLKQPPAEQLEPMGLADDRDGLRRGDVVAGGYLGQIVEVEDGPQLVEVCGERRASAHGVRKA
jgi:hypothetical protein